MRRFCGVSAVLFPPWQWVRFQGTESTEASIRRRVQEAIQKARKSNRVTWVPIACVSSYLPDDVREELASVGGLAGYCRNQHQKQQGPQMGEGSGGALFAVKVVDGMLCVKMTDGNISKGSMGGRLENSNLVVSQELLHFLRQLPDQPVAIAACQRAWGLSSEEAVECAVWNALKELECSLRRREANLPSVSSYVQIGFVGKRPAFISQGRCTMALLREEDPSTERDTYTWFDEDFSPQYDLWRMSRFLLTEDFTSIQHVDIQTRGIIQTPLLQVAMTYPERISLQLGSTVDRSNAVEGRYYVNGRSHHEVDEVIGLKFILSEDEVAKHLKFTNSRLSNLTEEELSAERAKLKNIPPLRRSKLRRAVVREEFRRRFPLGNVFLNPNVVAFHVYDLMTPGEWHSNSVLRDTVLPDGGKGCMHVGVDFFDQFPHLFITQGVCTTTVNVMRREQGMEAILGDGEIWKRTSFRDEDILLSMLQNVSHKLDEWAEGKPLSIFVSRLPRHMFKYLQKNGGAAIGLAGILKKYPEAFEVTPCEGGNMESDVNHWFVRPLRDGVESLGVRLISKLQTTDDPKDSSKVEEDFDSTPQERGGN
ncbi:uncharacterized protein TEOVI_000448400 [Trypanosoma equiperdum]|uniref:Uncharacterized protein n=1 Tax=Trypanosoma equiperdum TaxID=5694 RepID=A0A1G4IKM2_TRYEQ|nr:hypothetical protein, conserved [Trypanosoma equiperdum]